MSRAKVDRDQGDRLPARDAGRREIGDVQDVGRDADVVVAGVPAGELVGQHLAVHLGGDDEDQRGRSR
jgi:hypothetical protein